MIVCHLSHVCIHYDNGSNKPPNEHVRLTIPCIKYLDTSCDIDIQIRLFMGETIACDIDKMKRLKGK